MSALNSRRRRIGLAFLAAATLIATAGCISVPDWKTEGKVTRYVTIARHKFTPPKVVVPANAPFWLAIDGYDEVNGLVIQSEDLGIPRRTIRAHVHESRFPETDAPVRTRLPVKALAPGDYKITCDCHGKMVTGTVTAVPQQIAGEAEG